MKSTAKHKVLNNSSEKFYLIGITTDEFFAGEAEMIEKLLDGGLDYVHIRKPEASREELRDLISKIRPEYHSRLKLHDHFELAKEFGVGGININRRNPIPPEGDFTLSRSCHSLAEIKDFAAEYPDYEYMLLSPVFDSISKKGYTSAFKLEDLTDTIEGKNVIALGGVTMNVIPHLKKAGFSGAAMLGTIWNNPDEFCKLLKTY